MQTHTHTHTHTYIYISGLFGLFEGQSAGNHGFRTQILVFLQSFPSTKSEIILFYLYLYHLSQYHGWFQHVPTPFIHIYTISGCTGHFPRLVVDPIRSSLLPHCHPPLVGGLEHSLFFIYWEFHHPNWLFVRAVETTNQTLFQQVVPANTPSRSLWPSRFGGTPGSTTVATLHGDVVAVGAVGMKVWQAEMPAIIGKI